MVLQSIWAIARSPPVAIALSIIATHNPTPAQVSSPGSRLDALYADLQAAGCQND